MIIMPKTCLPCNAFFDGDICEICFNPAATYMEVVAAYKGYEIKKYSNESGYRVDFGTKRSKMVPTVEDAQRLIEYR